MRAIALFTFLAISFLFASCGKKSKTETAKKIVWISPEELDTIMSYQYFECASLEADKKCPSGVAKLLTPDQYEENKFGVCTGFMVDETTMVTNNHCLSTKEDCKNTYIAVYNENGGYTQTKCDEVIATEIDYKNPNDRRKSKDYSIIKIKDRIEQKSFSLAQTPSAAGDELSVWVVDHKSQYSSRISQFKCNVQDQSTFSSVVLENCPVIGGNSGSPALNENNEVVGIIWGSKKNSMGAYTSLRERRSTGGLALMTDLYELLYRFY